METTFSTEMLLLLAGGLMITGAVAGVLAGLLGVGGGIVIVPVLFWVLGGLDFPAETAMHMAVGTSLATIVPTSISSMRAHMKRGSVDSELLRLWAPAIIVGAALGGVLSKVIDGNGLKLIFGGIALAVSLNMARPKQFTVADGLPKNGWLHRTIAAGIGTFSALMGIGGGTLSVPTLTMFSFPMIRAVGTASVLGLLIATPAVLGFVWSGYGVDARPPWSLGYVSLPAACIIFPVTVVCAPLGARIAHAMNQRPLKLAFAVFLGITSARMLWSALGQ